MPPVEKSSLEFQI